MKNDSPQGLNNFKMSFRAGRCTGKKSKMAIRSNFSFVLELLSIPSGPKWLNRWSF
jgi:hypothetical protein